MDAGLHDGIQSSAALSRLRSCGLSRTVRSVAAARTLPSLLALCALSVPNWCPDARPLQPAAHIMTRSLLLHCALALQPVFTNTSGNPKMWFSSPGRGPTRTKPTAGQSWRSHERPRSQQHHAALAGWPTALRPAPPYASSMRSRHANTGSSDSSRAVALTLLAIMKQLNTMMSA